MHARAQQTNHDLLKVGWFSMQAFHSQQACYSARQLIMPLIQYLRCWHCCCSVPTTNTDSQRVSCSTNVQPQTYILFARMPQQLVQQMTFWVLVRIEEGRVPQLIIHTPKYFSRLVHVDEMRPAACAAVAGCVRVWHHSPAVTCLVSSCCSLIRPVSPRCFFIQQASYVHEPGY
jgi:hypothetical protein